MARERARDGTEPTKTRPVEVHGKIVEFPYCNICGKEMNEIKLSDLSFYKPGWKWLRKFPLKLGAYLCDPCREREGIPAMNYAAVPMQPGQDMRQALEAHLAFMNEHSHQHRFRGVYASSDTEIKCLDCPVIFEVQQYFDEEGYMRTKMREKQLG